jgi:hypothetical protein
MASQGISIDLFDSKFATHPGLLPGEKEEKSKKRGIFGSLAAKNPPLLLYSLPSLEGKGGPGWNR